MADENLKITTEPEEFSNVTLAPEDEKKAEDHGNVLGDSSTVIKTEEIVVNKDKNK